MKIKTLSFLSFKCFEDTEISCLKKDGKSVYQWTVLLGNNNTGKTSLLKAIADLRAVPWNGHSLKQSKVLITEKDGGGKQFVPAGIHLLLNDSEDSVNLDEKMLVECITTLENTFRWKYGTNSCATSKYPGLEDFRIYAYGVSRYPSKTSLSESQCDDCASLFHPDQRLINIEEWLMQLDYAAKSNNRQAEERLNRIRELLCGNLFPEILEFRFESNDRLHNYTLFQTEDGWFRYTELGYGYQSMLSWVIDLCKRMFERYPASENPLQEEAIVLVDEIDLHLHPAWQRDIISFLSKVFPNVQFIVTTHSPLVVQSMNEVNLYVLHREGNKVKVDRSEVTNFKGWTVEEILRDTMRMKEDIHTGEYQKYMKLFDEGLDESDREKLKAAYETLCRILHPENSARRLLELQYNQLLHD